MVPLPSGLDGMVEEEEVQSPDGSEESGEIQDLRQPNESDVAKLQRLLKSDIFCCFQPTDLSNFYCFSRSKEKYKSLKERLSGFDGLNADEREKAEVNSSRFLSKGITFTQRFSV